MKYSVTHLIRISVMCQNCSYYVNSASKYGCNTISYFSHRIAHILPAGILLFSRLHCVLEKKKNSFICKYNLKAANIQAATKTEGACA